MKTEAEVEAHRLAMKKRADKYIGRAGEPPSLLSRAKYGRDQDTNDDDRRHLRWCLRTIRAELGRGSIGHDALAFIEVLLNRDYALNKGADLPIAHPEKDYCRAVLAEERNRVPAPRPRKSGKDR